MYGLILCFMITLSINKLKRKCHIKFNESVPDDSYGILFGIFYKNIEEKKKRKKLN